jgi:pimeloyl-ACP methyl ester carboxylesterase
MAQPSHFEPWAAYFRAAGYRCLVPALPGHAPSDLTVIARATFADYVEAMAAAIASLPEPPVVIGYSMGGLIAQRLAASHELAGLVLLASATPWMLPPNRLLFRYGLPQLFRVLAGRPFRIPDDAIRELVLHHLSVAEQDEILRDVVPESGHAFLPVALGAVRVRADDVRCPVLCVAGAEDRVVALSSMRALADRYGAELITVPGCGHWPGAGSLLSVVARPVRDWIGGLGQRRDPSFRGGADL